MMVGTPRLRARIAVCEVAPPDSVMRAETSCCCNNTQSAGAKSCTSSTRPRIGIAHVAEGLQQRLALHLQRPFGVALMTLDKQHRLAREGAVFGHEEVHVDEREDVDRDIARDLPPCALQLTLHRRDGGAITRDFVGEIMGGDAVVADVGLAAAL